MRAKTSLPVLLTILMLAPPAGATTMYSYVGDVFHAVSGNYSTSDRITGSLTLADGFVPNTQLSGPKDLRPGIIAYSFTDGHQTLTESNSTLGTFEFTFWNPADRGQLESHPNLEAWTLAISALTGGIASNMFGDGEDWAWLGSVRPVQTACGPPGQATFCPSDQSYGYYGVGGALNISYEGGRGTWTVTAIPEPETLLLLAIGLAGVALGSWARP